MASNHLLRLGSAVLLLGSLGGPPAHADAPPAKIAPESGTTLPAELLTIPEPPRAGNGIPQDAPLLPGPDEAAPAPASATRISLDSRDRPPLPAVADGDRDRSLLVRLRWPF